MKDVCDALHAYDTETRIYCHICDDILPIAGDLVDTGFDCIGPLDPLRKTKMGLPPLRDEINRLRPLTGMKIQRQRAKSPRAVQGDQVGVVLVLTSHGSAAQYQRIIVVYQH